MRRLLVISGALGVLLVAGTAYTRLLPAPQDAPAEAVGIRGRVPVDERFCGYVVRRAPIGEWPTGEALCVWSRRESARRRADRDELKFHLLSRRVRHAHRSWEPLSEAAFRSDRDSVRAALLARGGTPVRCWWMNTEVLTGSEDRFHMEEYWSFPGYGMAVYSAWGTRELPGHPAEQRYYLHLRGSRERAVGC